jgi:gliding motility-associated-like protein
MINKLLTRNILKNLISNLHLKFLFGLFALILMQNFFAQSANPSVSLGSNQIICSGSNTATVTATTNNLGALTVSSYAWTVEGVSVGTSSSTSITVNASLSPNNPQDVNCVATLSDGSTINDNMKVFTISPGVIAGDQLLCNSPFDPSAFTSADGGTTSLSNVNNFNDSYQWESAPTANGPWTPINGANNATYNPSNLSSTTYFRRVLEVTIGNNNPVSQSCVSNTVVVQILNAPTITTSQCIANGATANMAVSFNPTLPSGYTATYSWSGPNSYSAASATASVTSFAANKAGTYTANVSVSNGNNTCTYSLTTQLNLIPNTPTFTIPSSGCPGTSFQPTGFTAQTTPSTIGYQWNILPFNGGSTGVNGTNPTFLFNSGGDYNISVTATNPNGSCTATSNTNIISIPVFSSENPTVGVAGSFYNPQIINGVNTIAICAGLSVSAVTIYNNNTLNNGGTNPAGATYTYSLNGSAPSTILDDISQTIYYGNNNLIINANYQGCTLTNTVNVYSGSNPFVSLGTSNSIGLCPGNALTFTINPIPLSGQANPPGTSYTMTYSDSPGTSNVFNDIAGPTSVSHNYLSTSCGMTYPGNLYPANTFYAQVTAQNYCGQTSSTVSPITVNDFPIANFTVTDSTICANQSITVTNTGDAGSVVGNNAPYNCNDQGKFYWTITGGVSGVDYNVTAGVLGFFNNTYNNPSGSVNTTGNGSSTLNITFNTAGTYTITQHYHNGCGTKTKVRNICVINPPTCQFTATPSSGCTPLTVAINNTTVAPNCGGTPVPLTYAWTVTSPTGTTASYTSNSAQAPPNLVLTNPTALPQSFTISLTVTPKDPYAPAQNFGNPNCTSTCSQTVTVNPKPVYTPVNITTCNDPYTAAINLQSTTNIANCTFNWQASENPNVIGESTTAQTTSTINDILDNTVTSPQTISYTITPTSPLGCVGNAATSTILLNYVDAGVISSDITVCNGADPGPLTGTTPVGTGNISYQWQSSLNGGTTWNNITTNGTGANYDPPAGISANTCFKRIVTFNSNNTNCQATSNSVCITVNTVNPGTISTAQNLCTGDDPIALNVGTAATGTGATTFIWQQSSNSTGPWTSIQGQTGSSYDPPVLGSTTYFSIAATSVLNNVSCSANTPAIAVTVNTLTPGSISSSQTICTGGDPVAFTSVAATTNASSSTIAYQWQTSTDNVNWTNITNATSATFNPPALTATTYYRRLVNVLIGSTVICQGQSNTITITVIPDPTVSAPTGQTICTGGSPTALTVTPNGGTNTSYSYQWFSGSTAISGATSSSYTPPSSNGTYYCQVTINPSASTGCLVNSSNATITVVNDPVVTAPTSASYCQDAASVSALSVSASGGLSTNYTYQWYVNNSNNNSGGSIISGANTPNYTPPVNVTGIKYYYCLVSISPASNGCSTASAVAAITVTAGPSVSSQPANQTRCIGGAFTALTVATTGGSGTPSYQWYSNTTNSSTGGTLITGATSASYPPPSNLSASAGVTYYYCVISFAATGGCSQISSNAAAVTVLAAPSLNPMSNQVYCHTNAVPTTALTGNYSSGMTYVWNLSGPSIGLSPISGTTSNIPAFTANNTGTSAIVATVTVTPSYTITNVNSGSNLTCTGTATTAFTFTINPIPDMPAFISPQLFVFCEDDQALVPFTANISTGMSYNWTNDNTQIGVAASGTSASPGLSFTAVNNLSNPNQPLTSNFYVTPVYTNQGLSCPGAAEFFAITINPLPDVNPLADTTLCATTTGYNQYSSFNPINGPGTSYVWTNTNPAIGLPSSGTGDFYFTSTNTTLVPISGTVSVTPTYTNNNVTCTGAVEEFMITINPMPTVDPIANQGLCLGSATTAVNPTGNIPNTIYNWTNSNSSTGLAASGSGLIPSFVGLNTTTAPNVSTVSVVPSYTNNNLTCLGATAEFGITINPTPNVNAVADQQVCAQYNTTVQFTSTPNIVGTVYNWTNNNTSIGLAATGSGSLSFNAINTTNAPISAEIIVTPSFTFAGSTCTGMPETFNIVVLPTPVMSALSNETLCSGTATTAINFSSNLTGTQFAWTNSNIAIGLGASGSGNNIGSFNVSNTGTAPSQGLISVAPSLVTNNQTCIGSPVTATITVNPIPVMTTVNNPSFCFGAAATIPLSSNISTGVTYNWINSNTEIGLTGSGSGSISFSTNNPYTTAISGLVTISPVYTNNSVQCPGTPSSFTIQVAPNPQVTPLNNIDFCSGIQSTAIPISGTVTGATYSWTNANPAIGLQAAGSGNIPVFTTANASTTSVASSLVTVTPNLSFNGQSCQGPSTTFTISINPGTTINSIPNVKLCNGETSIPINFSGSGSTYSWSSSNTNIGIASNGATSIQPFVATNTGTTPLNATITVTSQFTGGSGNGCNGGSTTFNIEVLPTPSVVAPPNLVVCHGDAVNAVNLYGVATNYTWTNNATSIGLTNTGSTATIPAFTATNTGNNPVLATVNISPSYVSGTKVCTGTSQSYTINVIPIPTITSQPQSQTVCLGGSLTNLSVAYAGGNGTPTYQWFSSPTNSTANGIAITGANSATYALPAANTVGTTYYYCILTFANAATCATISTDLATITITSGPSISTQPLASQAICAGGSIPAALSVAFSNGTGNATIQWFSVNGGTNTAISGANATSYLPGVFNTVGTYYYMAQISLSGSGCGLAQSNTVQINVLADPIITNPSPASYCLNSSTAVPLSITASGGTSTPYIYQWYSNSVNNNTSGTLISGANAASYIPATTSVATTYYYCVVTQGNGCSVSSNAAAIAVTSAPSISSQPIATQTVCLDGTVSALSVTYASGSGSPSYQWYSNSSNSYVGGVAIPGAGSSSYMPATNLVGTIYYYCVITFASSGCSSISSNISQIVVVADPIVSTQPLNTQTICGGGSIPNALNVAYTGGTGTLSYQWFSINSGTNTLIGGATASSYLPPAFSTPGTYNFAAQVSLSGSGCGMVQSNNAQVIVLPDPTVSAPVSATYCNGYTPVQPLSVTANGGLTAAYAYQWYSNTVNSNTGGTLINGATASTYTPPVSTNGSEYYYCVVSQGAANTGCSIASATALIITSPAPAIATQPSTMQTACVGGTLNNLTVSYIGASTTPSYQWYSNTTNTNTGGTPVPGATAATYLPQNSTAGTTYYYCVISFPAISCTTISSNPGGVTIHPDPIISVQPIANQAICFGTTLSAPLNISYTGGFGTPSYQWNIVNGSTATAIQNATNATYLPGNFNLAGTYNFNVTLTLSGNGCNVQTSNQAEVIVMPVPVVDPVGSELYCNDDLADLVHFTGPITGTTYSWVNDNPGIGLAASGFGDIVPFTVTNMNNFGIVGNISVTPQLTTYNTVCSGTPVEFQIMVNPYQDVQDPQDLVLCHGTGVNGVQFFGSALINNWTNDQPALGIPAAGSGTLPAFLAVNNGTQPIIANLSVTPSFNAVTTCPGDIETFTITILPNPNVSVLPLAQTICSGDLSNTINMSGTATSFAWTNNTPSVGLPANGTGNIPAFLTSATGSNTTATIAVTPMYTLGTVSCPGPSQNVQITVVPTPSTLPLPDLVYCNGEATNLIQILGNASELNWSSSNPSIGTAALGSGSIPSFNVINNSQSPVSSVITVTPVNFFGGLTCMAPAEDFSITVNPTPTINPIPDQVLCAQSNSPAMLFSGNATGFEWNNTSTAIGLSATGVGNISSFVTQNSLPSVLSANISVVPQFTNAGLTCEGAPELFTIDVLPTPTLSPVNPQVLCNGSATAPIDFVGNATNYTWINNNPTVGLAAAGSGDIAGFNAIAGATNNVANIVITPSYTYNSTTCFGTPVSTSITVLPSPYINTVQDVVTCNGDLSGVLAFSGTATSFNWTNSNPAIGLAAGGSGNLPVFTNTNTSSNPLLATITVTPETAQGTQTCQGTPEIFTITVNPTPTVNTVSSQLICSQDQTQPVVFAGNASSYSWLNNNTSIGLPSFGNGNIPAFTALNTGVNTAIAQIQVTPQYTNAGATCTGAPQNFTFSVDPIPVVQYSQIGQAICTGTNSASVNLSSTTPGVSYGWTILNPSPAITGIPNMNGTGNLPSMALVNAGSTSSQFNFQGMATTPLVGCTGYGPLGTITVDPAPIMQPLNDLTICSNALINYNLVASLPSTFSWTASTNTNVVGQPTSAVNSNLIYNTLQNNSSTLQNVTYTVTPTSFPAGCVGQPETFVAEVVPNIQITSLANYEICSGEPTDITLQANLPGTFTFSAVNNQNVQGETVNSQTGFYINDILSNTTAYDQLVSYNVQVVSSPYNCYGLPQLITVEVHPEISITNPSPTQMCSGAPFSLNLTATENANFSWYATQNGSVNGESTTTQNSNTLDDNLSLAPGVNTHQIVNYTISATSTVTGCDAQSLPLSIIVNPVPVVDPSIDQLWCSGSSIYPINFNGTATNYAWANNNPAIGLASNGNGNIPAFNVTNPGPQTLVSTITVTPQYINNGFICAGAQDQLTITVEPIPSISYDIPNQDLCSGEQSDPVQMSSPNTGASISWQIINPPLSVGGINNLTGTNTLPSMTLTNISTGPQQVFFQGTVTTPLNACQTQGPIGQIVVLPEPVMTTINDLTICSGQNISEILSTSNFVPSYFIWGAQNNPNVNGESVGPVNSNFIYNSLVNTSSTLQYVDYTITPTSVIGGCIGADLDFTVEVIPDIALNQAVTPLQDTICSGELTNILLQTNYPSAIIWHAINNPNVSGETTTATAGNYISDILVNNTPFNQYVQYYVDMVSSPQGCNGIPELITVLVYPAIQLTNVTNINLCSNEQLDLNLAATVNANFTWSATNNGVVQGESTTPQNNSLLNDLLVNNSAFTEQVFYTVDVLALNSGCQAYDLPITVNVLPLPVLLNNDTTICSGQLTNVNLVTNIPASIVWNGVFNIPILGETYANISGNYINDLLVNNTGQDETLVYEVLATSNGCTAPLDYVLVIVHDQPDIDFSILTNPICSQDNVQFTNLSNPNFDFDWSFGDGATSEEYSPLHIYNNSGIYDVMLVGTNPLNNCSAAESLSIVVNKMPDASFYTTDTIGCGNLNATFFANYQATSDMVWDFGDGQTLAQVGNVTNYYGQAGCYDVTLTVTSPEGCVAQESYDDYVCVYENPIAFIGASPVSVNALNPTVQFSNASQHAISYIWQMGDGGISYDDNPTYTYPMEGADYHVTMTAFNEVGCFDTTSIDIHVYEELIFYVPNTFTPNDDEKNQTFYPVLSQGMKRTYMDFYIYNRWGELVFESHDPAYGWDGTYGPTALDSPIGTYTWKLKLETLQTQEIVEFHGHVNLIR